MTESKTEILVSRCWLCVRNIRVLLSMDTFGYFQITANKMQRFLIYLLLQTLYMFQVVPPPIIKSTQLCIQLQVLSTNSGASCYRQLTVAVSNLFLVLIASRCFFIGVALKDVDLPVSLSPSF